MKFARVSRLMLPDERTGHRTTRPKAELRQPTLA
jgi:hypothetical protein